MVTHSCITYMNELHRYVPNTIQYLPLTQNPGVLLRALTLSLLQFKRFVLQILPPPKLHLAEIENP